MKNIFIVIPAYNAEDTVAKVIQGCTASIPRERIVVVDDGSTDRTAKIVIQTGIKLLPHDKNRGKGAALQTGFEYALSSECDAVITLDADMQHSPAEIPLFLDRFNSESDIIIGSRKRARSAMPLDRRFSNWFTSLLMSIRTQQKIEDSQSGYRLIKKDVLQTVKTEANGFIAESEMLIRASINKFKISHVEISTIYSEEESHINRFSDTMKFISMYFRSFFW